MRPRFNSSRYAASAIYGSAPNRFAASTTASSNGRSSNACRVLWWTNTPMGPWRGSRCAACSTARRRMSWREAGPIPVKPAPLPDLNGASSRPALCFDLAQHLHGLFQVGLEVAPHDVEHLDENRI